MHVELYEFTTGKPQLMAVIRGDGSIEPKMVLPDGMQQNIADQKARVPGATAFLRSLLLEYSGSRLRAKLIG